MPRSQHAEWTPRRDRDPVGILEASNETRVPELIPYRFGRMAISPFAFFRGSAAVMAADLADTPVTGLRVQACGDAHVSNFGEFATPERRVVFDINDFDETLPGAWEWDVKRLAASIDLVARDRTDDPDARREMVSLVVREYRERLRAFAQLSTLDLWHATITVDDVLEHFPKHYRPRVARHLSRARRKTHDGPCRSSPRWSTGIAGSSSRRRSSSGCIGPSSTSTTRWASSMATGRRCRTIGGTSSTGSRWWTWPARPSASGASGRAAGSPSSKGRGSTSTTGSSSRSRRPGRRSSSRTWASRRCRTTGFAWSPGNASPNRRATGSWAGPKGRTTGRHYYVRQLWDLKGSGDPTLMDPVGLTHYGALCAWALARAHARTGDAVAIGSYLGKTRAFDDAIAGFAARYADQAELDHAALVEAIASGRVPAETEIEIVTRSTNRSL